MKSPVAGLQAWVVDCRSKSSPWLVCMCGWEMQEATAPLLLLTIVQVWMLDATPGEVRAGGDGEDHPQELIQALATMPGPITDRKQVVAALCAQGFSTPVAQWMTTNLRPASAGAGAPGAHPSPGAALGAPGGGSLEWTFELEGIAEMYRSYEDTDLWPMVESVPEGVRIEFLRAERSLHRWAHGDVQRIGSAELRASAEGAGVRMHVLEDAGHWVSGCSSPCHGCHATGVLHR